MNSFSRGVTQFIDRFYIAPIARVIPRQTFRYAVSGGFNLVVGWIAYHLIYMYIIGEHNIELSFITISPHVATLIICFPITFSLGFILNKFVAFKFSPLRTRTQLTRYLLSVTGSLLLNYALIKFFVETLHLYPTLGQIISTLLITVYSYLAQKYFTFRGNSTE